MRARWGMLAAIVAFAGGCKGKTADDGAATSSDDPAHQLARAVCGALATCCGAAGFAYDDAPCVAQEVNRWQGALDPLKRAGVTFDRDAFEACKGSLAAREALCADDAGPGDGGPDTPSSPCSRMVVGALAPGAPCDVPEQCAHDPATQAAECTNDLDPASPTFGAPFCAVIDLVAPVGASCAPASVLPSLASPHTAECDPSTGSCVLTSPDAKTGVCTVFLPTGSACTPGEPTLPACPPNAPCTFEPPDGGPSYTCTPPSGAGATCVFGTCDQGLYCDSQSAQCKPKVALGDRCASYDACPTNSYCAGLQLAADGGTTLGRCFSYGGSPTTWDVSPRSCGFGPYGFEGPDDAGIAH